MKRSEMIEKIVDFFDYNEIWENDRDAAERLLDKLEILGMLPPLVKDVCVCNTYENCPYHDRNYANKYYYWEQ